MQNKWIIYPSDLGRAYGTSGLWALYTVYVAENEVTEKAPFVRKKLAKWLKLIFNCIFCNIKIK